MENQNQNMFLDWNDTIESDGQEYVILPEGDYAFRVTNFERGRFPGSAKIPACNKATLTLSIDTPEGPAICRTDLILYRTMEWQISAFFRSIGQKKHGEKLVMDWNKVPGAVGHARFKPRDYTASNGKTRQANDVVRYIDPENVQPQQAAAPTAQQWVNNAAGQQAMPMYPNSNSWNPNQF